MGKHWQWWIHDYDGKLMHVVSEGSFEYKARHEAGRPKLIKAVGRTGDGTPLLILGLSGENMTRLMASEPIRVNLAQLGLPSVTVVIVGGKTEESITQDLVNNGLLELGGQDGTNTQ